jgi:hypothetical protein
VTPQQKSYQKAVEQVADRIREVNDLLLDAMDAMNAKRPKDAWTALDNAWKQLNGAMVTAKWSQTLVEETG